MRPLTCADLDKIPRLGWVREPSPVTRIDDQTVGGVSLSIKRDDLLGALHGGTKTRKLDYLLATPALRFTRSWSSVGAIGSGHLVALTAAARILDRRVHAHCFWEPLTQGALDNLAFVASHGESIRYYSSRAALGLRCPSVLLRKTWRDTRTIPPGATTGHGMVGVVRAGLELAEQINRGEVEAPEHLYVALGTGGTAVGLSVGLGLGGLYPTIHAVAAVERLYSTRAGLGHLQRQLLATLAAGGVEPGHRTPAPIVVDHGEVGPGYGHPTAVALAACEQFRDLGVPLEPVYSGKAMAALMKAAAAGNVAGPVMFWSTNRGRQLPVRPNWRARLPAELRHHIDCHEATL